MVITPSRNPPRSKSKPASRPPRWPRKITVGRASVTIYKRRTPAGKAGFLVANYSAGRRRLDSYPDEASALEAAGTLARLLSTGQVLAAELTNADASELASAKQTLAPLGLGLLPAVAAFAEAVKILGGNRIVEAARFFIERNPAQLPVKTVREVVDELLAAKSASDASARYAQDLRHRLLRFADAFRCPIGSVSGDQIQAWLDSRRLAPQTQLNFRRVLRLLFGFAIRRRYLPKGWDELDRLESVKVRRGEITIYTPDEIQKLLSAADPDFLPVLAIAAFAGLRSAELERLAWAEVHLAEGFIEVTAGKSKTSSRRLAPIPPNLRAWLTPYAERTGPVWPLGPETLYKRQQQTARLAGLVWRANAPRHAFISYRLAEVQDAAKVSLESGNSPKMIFQHYRELVTPAQAAAWFALRPAAPGNVVALTAAQA